MVLGEPEFEAFDEDEDDWEEVDEDDEEEELEMTEEEREAAIDAAAILTDTSRRLVDAIRRWCFQQTVAPAERLEEAAPLLLTAVIPALALSEAGMVDPKDMPSPDDLVASLIGDRPEAEQDDLRVAMDQVHEFMKQFNTPKELFTAVGYEEGEEET